MTSFERDAMGAICLLAAFADGEPAPAELERLKAITSGPGMGGGAGLSSDVYQRVMMKQVDIGTEAARLGSPEVRRQAFELAVGICDADGVTTDAERAFLMNLARQLQIDDATARATIDNADQLAADPLSRPIGMTAAGAAAPPPLPVSAGSTGVATSDAEVDSSIRNHAILCGALELLPQGLASAAIIPVQMKMVYSIGKRYGYSLDSGHVKDLLATVGVGVTSQIVESFGRRIMGGLVESIAGRVVGRTLGHGIGSLARGGTSAAFTFASTYALGQVAKQYYAGGRKMSAIDLKAVFARSVEQGKSAYGQYAPAIQQQAGSLNPARLLDLVRA
jgi:uncharacterized protein (DUF697 family)/tellurite resistance protein